LLEHCVKRWWILETIWQFIFFEKGKYWTKYLFAKKKSPNGEI
jgi:hypothetical protein